MPLRRATKSGVRRHRRRVRSSNANAVPSRTARTSNVRKARRARHSHSDPTMPARLRHSRVRRRLRVRSHARIRSSATRPLQIRRRVVVLAGRSVGPAKLDRMRDLG